MLPGRTLPGRSVVRVTGWARGLFEHAAPIQLNAAHTAFELISLDEAKPRVVGAAIIEPYSELDARRDLHAVFAVAPVHALAS